MANPQRPAPLVSVITPAHNAAATLAAALASVQAQEDISAWEILVVDDASTDATATLLADAAAQDRRIRPFHLAENGGAAVARNTAIRNSRGRYIAFLDADDRWLPDKLARQLTFMQARQAVLSHTAYRRVDDAGASLGIVPAAPRLDHRTMLGGNAIGCLTAIYDSAALGRMEMPDIRYRQDYGLWLDILRPGRVSHGLDEVLAEYRVAPGSLSGNKLAAARWTWRLLRDVEGLPRYRAAACFTRYALGGVGKRSPLRH